MKFICHLKISIHIIKLKIKNKGKNKRAARKKNLIQRNPQRLSTDFSAKILKARAEWDDTFKILKKKKRLLQPRILYSAKLPFRNEEKIKTFLDLVETWWNERHP